MALRGRGGLKQVREGVWRVDVELPRDPGGGRRRVSKTVIGRRGDAEQALAELADLVRTGGGRRAKRGGKKRARMTRHRGSGAVSPVGPGRWLVGVEGPADLVTGRRRRYTRTVRGSREEAEIVLARLKLSIESGSVPIATNARNVRSAPDRYRDSPTRCPRRNHSGHTWELKECREQILPCQKVGCKKNQYPRSGSLPMHRGWTTMWALREHPLHLLHQVPLKQSRLTRLKICFSS